MTRAVQYRDPDSVISELLVHSQYSTTVHPLPSTLRTTLEVPSRKSHRLEVR
ncbi:MAG: hypothetical protein KME40_31215 [Komarekiella atlantica HA4396-MV6]|nr:hypothetical protein [Komarekiella atlantica HA4396-MV6]